MRVRIAVILSLVLGFATLALAAPASAAPPALTVTPNADLVDGTLLTIHGTGFPPSETLFGCEGIVDSTPSSSDCGHGIPFDTAADGSFTVQFAVRRFITVATTGVMVDCADPSNTCGIGAQTTEDLNGPAVAVTLSFQPQADVPRPDLIVRSRATGALFGDNVYGVSNRSVQDRRHVFVDSKWVYAVVVQNDGNQADDLILTSPHENDSDYFYGYYDVTALVNGAGLKLHIAAGQSVLIAYRCTQSPGSGAFDALVTVHSAAATELTDALILRCTEPL